MIPKNVFVTFCNQSSHTNVKMDFLFRHIISHVLNSQGHNLYKLQYVSLEEVKIVSFQQCFQSEAIESNLFRLCLKLFTPRSNFSPSKI